MNNFKTINLQSRAFLPLVIILISIIPVLDLFHPGLPITHDGQDHVARIANFYQNLSDGNIIPRWGANLNWGYGHPILMFLYPLPSYIASFFHFLGFSLVDSTKIVFGVAFVLSGLTMYLWVNEFLGKRAAFVSTILFFFAPYRFVDLYVRGAIGEHVAFIFPPLIFYFLLKLSKKYSYWYIVGGGLAIAGFILSHNAVSLMFLPLILLYAVYLVWQSSQRRALLGRFGILGILGFGLSAFFWMPAFFEGKYTLRDIVTSSGEYASHFVSFKSLLWGEWNYDGSGQFSTQVGIAQWIGVIGSLFAIMKLLKKNNVLLVLGTSAILIFCITLFLMTANSGFFWETITILQKFQFPWRFLSVTVFASALLGGIFVSMLSKKIQLITCYLFLIILAFFSKDYWHAKDYLYKGGAFFTGVYNSTTDTGESSPRWSVRFMEKEPKAYMEVIDGEAIIEEIGRTSTAHVYTVDGKKRLQMRENTLYFPGWEVLVDGQKTVVEYQDPANRGLLTFFVDKGKHDVEVKFGETKLRRLANSFSLVSLAGVGIGLVLFLTRNQQWQKRR